MKKILSVITAAALVLTALTACSSNSQSEGQAQGFDSSKNITVISREDGSGTRGAFVELTGVESKNADGVKEDHTTVEAVIASKTDVMLTNVASDAYAIGYVSMGSLNDTVKAVSVDGAKATTENVKNGTYTIARPFNIATKGEVNEVTADFIAFMLSKQGQGIASGSYIAIDDNAKEYTASNLTGKIVVAGSSSVAPLMQKMIDAYAVINPNVTVELQTSDSTSGMNDAISGVCDIGMASRDLKDSEKQTLTSTAIAMDGIAVIVNTENTVENLTKDSIKEIYTGKAVSWQDVNK